MKDKIQLIIQTLKTLDVRGFESMDKLVGCVMMLNSIVNEIESEEKQNG